jgi:hypothetical protein
MDVAQWLETAMDSIKKNTVDATMEIEMIQKEIATGSFGFKNPCDFKSSS